ncbi:FAD-linked oxidase C-terminal domain-containing protein [Saxibacter everestensis]|uniref:FAD-linked oxidase C-terminal domain-containing protein n=1 Tax=Saxibacter everestensis TaxID=2909229 RepID=A0ABY8QSJ5_9MICO|nr:FAD-linked oxidase C-terminal domain-containing protein [Brevibacteriaceae bacterium ZFBP1038]
MTTPTIFAKEALLADLASGLSEKALLSGADQLETYRFDMASFSPAGVPVAVVRAASRDDVVHALRTASKHGIPVVPQGAMSGLSGAGNAIDGCLVLSVRDMNRILEISVDDQVAVVEPGVLNKELSHAVAEQGLFYPPDPGSWEISTIGGNVATNAGGMCCVKYGVTGDFVRGLELVLADGTVLETGRRTAKGVAGFDLTSLVVGSEGCLGVITKVILGLKPAPRPSLTMAATFPDSASGLAAVTAIMASGVTPSLMEFLDPISVAAVNALQDMGFDDDCALILAQSDSPEALEDVARMAKIATANGAIDVAESADDQEAAMLLQSRRSLHAALEVLGGNFTDDVAVPRVRMLDLLAGIEEIAERNDIKVATAGHAGDGNMHPTVIFDRADEAAKARAAVAFEEIMLLGLELGGTITGEHGVGILKREGLRRELSATSLRLQEEIKHSFDPQGILNPGKQIG